MVQKDKRNKREYERNKRSEPGKGAADKNKEKPGKPGQSKAGEPDRGASNAGAQQPPSNFVGVREDAMKLITEANERFAAQQTSAKEETTKSDLWKRNITSNWTRYEIMSDDENDEGAGLTGLDWNYAMSTAAGSESRLTLKSEENWNLSGSTRLSNEFFNLDLDALESSLSAIPIHEQIDLPEEEICSETLEYFKKKANLLSSSEDAHGLKAAEKMMSILKLDTSQSAINETSSSLTSKVIPPKEVVDTSSSSNVVPCPQPVQKPINEGSLEFTKPPENSAPLEQRDRRRGRAKSQKVDESVGGQGDKISEDDKSSEAAAPPPSAPVEQAQPLGQRIRKRGGNRTKQEEQTEETKDASASVSTASTVEAGASQAPQPQDPKTDEVRHPEVLRDEANKSSVHVKGPNVAKDKDAEDLDFILSMEKKADKSGKSAEVGSGEKTEEQRVVQVQLVREEEKQSLEDWLDDFLAD